jgi:hypothetical protein
MSMGGGRGGNAVDVGALVRPERGNLREAFFTRKCILLARSALTV